TYAQKSLEFAKDICTRKEKLYKERQSINFVEFREAQYQESQAQLQLDEAHNQQKIAVEKLGVEEVNIQAADDLIKRHQANSLLQKGEVAEIFVQIGEWVNRGDSIARVIQMDTLKINGRAESKVLYPSEIHNRPVEVYLQLPNNRSERFEGRVTRVNLENQVSGMFFFEIEVANRKLDEFWLLRPNADVDIKVRLD
ncbi:MAG: HlyD family secretion protein, partial [Planctomycetota bacterium]|nr:HlyD family secretion protein [Planctomycetota bacterium]